MDKQVKPLTPKQELEIVKKVDKDLNQAYAPNGKRPETFFYGVSLEKFPRETLELLIVDMLKQAQTRATPKDSP